MSQGVSLKTWGAVALVMLLAASCAKDQAIPEGEDPRITEMRALVTSDFEREVLADGKITEQEYETSRQLFKTCMEDRGYTVEYRDDGGHSIGAPGPSTTTEELDADYADCEPGTMQVIAPYYQMIKSNPDNLDKVQAIVDCLKRNELVPENYTKDDIADAGDLVHTSAKTKAIDGCWEAPLTYVATEIDRTTLNPGTLLDQ